MLDFFCESSEDNDYNIFVQWLNQNQTIDLQFAERAFKIAFLNSMGRGECVW